MTRIYQGIIFPDVIQALVDIKVINSQADLMLKLENLDSNIEITGDAPRFRVVRRIEKMMKGEGKAVPAKESKKAFRQIIDNLNLSPKFKLKIPLSDYRYPGAFYLIVKGYFLGMNVSKSDKEMQVLFDYVLALCEEEKEIFKHHDSQGIGESINKKFYVSNESLDDEILRVFPDTSPDTASDEVSSIVLLVLRLHQYLHLFAIVEQDFYIVYGKQASQEELCNRKFITRLLPSMGSEGGYIGSVSKLIIHIYTSLGFSSQDKLIEHLCGDEIKCPDRLKRRFNRWKSGDSQITSKAINDLFQQSFEKKIPNELVIVVSLIDKLSRELIEMGLSVKWVITEVEKYKNYQKDIVKKLGTPYLDSKIISLDSKY